jgi:hypothetical protein
MLLSFALRVRSRKKLLVSKPQIVFYIKLRDSGEQKPSKEINIKNIFNQIKKNNLCISDNITMFYILLL